MPCYIYPVLKGNFVKDNPINLFCFIGAVDDPVKLFGGQRNKIYIFN